MDRTKPPFSISATLLVLGSLMTVAAVALVATSSSTSLKGEARTVIVAERSDMTWTADGPLYDSVAALSAQSDVILEGRVADMVAAGAEGELVGDDSPIPSQIWRVRSFSKGSPASSVLVLVPDPVGAKTESAALAPGMQVTMFLEETPAVFHTEAVFVLVGTNQGAIRHESDGRVQAAGADVPPALRRELSRLTSATFSDKIDAAKRVGR